MAKTLIVLPGDTKGIVPMGEAIEAIRTGFQEWGQDPDINVPRRRIHVPTGVRVSVHQDGVPGAGVTGLMTHCDR